MCELVHRKVLGRIKSVVPVRLPGNCRKVDFLSLSGAHGKMTKFPFDKEVQIRSTFAPSLTLFVVNKTHSCIFCYLVLTYGHQLTLCIVCAFYILLTDFRSLWTLQSAGLFIEIEQLKISSYVVRKV